MNSMVIESSAIITHCAFLKHDTHLNLRGFGLFGDTLTNISIRIADLQLPFMTLVINGVGIDFR